MIHELARKPDPALLIIFGATGELSKTRLLPALLHLSKSRLLPKEFSIMGFARSKFSDQEFRKAAKLRGKFAKKVFYSPGDFKNQEDFEKLALRIEDLETPGSRHSCRNRLFYFATLPSHYQTIPRQLKKSGLLVGCQIHRRQTRVLIEKPFGQDLKSAQRLDRTLSQYFAEAQIYRIDHYLGKETVQNIFTARFANSIFEPIWNKDYIDHVQISALEKVGIENRGALYEQSGALRDFVQNHLMQLLALTAMEPPVDLSTKSIRDERVKVIRSIRKPRPLELKNFVVVGQYQGYRQEANVHARSRTETFAALKLFIDNARWQRVPWYLRTGKRLDSWITEISIHFKPQALNLFPRGGGAANILTFRIQPNEGIFLNILAKYPGFGIRLHPVTMELGYHSAFRGEIPGAYERLLLDFMQGDQRLFARSDEIEHSWKYVDVLEKYRAGIKPIIYREGSLSLKAANDLIRRDGREWYI